MRVALNRWRTRAFPRWRVGLVGIVVAVLLCGGGCKPPASTPPAKEKPGAKPNPKTNPTAPRGERG